MCLCTRGCCVCTAWPQREPQTQGRRNHPIRFSSPVPPPHRHTSVPTESGVPVPDQPNENRPPRGLRESHVDFFSLKNEICSPPNVQRSDTLCFQCCCFLAKKETVPRVLHDTGCPRGESPPRPLGLGAPGEEDRQFLNLTKAGLGQARRPTSAPNSSTGREAGLLQKHPEPQLPWPGEGLRALLLSAPTCESSYIQIMVSATHCE